MSDLALPEPKLLDPPRAERWLVWSALASLLVHAGLLLVLLATPLRDALEATPPQAIEVELVPPPEVEAEPPPLEVEAAEPPPPEAEPPASEPTPADPAASPPAAPAPPEAAPAATTPPATAAEAEVSAAAAGAPAPAAPDPSVSPPIPLPRPPSRTVDQGGAAGPSGAPVAALNAETGDAEGNSPDALSADPGVAALELGDLRTAERFYLEAMLEQPGLARARDMLQTLPRDKRLSQTCNIEALAQIGYSGEDFAPDVVMTDAYARSVITDTVLSATGAVFRSQDKWYGLAFDCTLSDDLTEVTAFSYRLGADVTDAVLARLEQP